VRAEDISVVPSPRPWRGFFPKKRVSSGRFLGKIPGKDRDPVE